MTISCGRRAAQKQAQQVRAANRTKSHSESEVLDLEGFDAAKCERVRDSAQMHIGGRGIRTPPETLGKTAFFDEVDAKSGAVPFGDPDLASLAAAWPRLSLAMKAGILAMVRAAGG